MSDPVESSPMPAVPDRLQLTPEERRVVEAALTGIAELLVRGVQRSRQREAGALAAIEELKEIVDQVTAGWVAMPAPAMVQGPALSEVPAAGEPTRRRRVSGEAAVVAPEWRQPEAAVEAEPVVPVPAAFAVVAGPRAAEAGSPMAAASGTPAAIEETVSGSADHSPAAAAEDIADDGSPGTAVVSEPAPPEVPAVAVAAVAFESGRAQGPPGAASGGHEAASTPFRVSGRSIPPPSRSSVVELPSAVGSLDIEEFPEAFRSLRPPETFVPADEESPFLKAEAVFPPVEEPAPVPVESTLPPAALVAAEVPPKDPGPEAPAEAPGLQQTAVPEPVPDPEVIWKLAAEEAPPADSIAPAFSTPPAGPVMPAHAFPLPAVSSPFEGRMETTPENLPPIPPPDPLAAGQPKSPAAAAGITLKPSVAAVPAPFAPAFSNPGNGLPAGVPATAPAKPSPFEPPAMPAMPVSMLLAAPPAAPIGEPMPAPVPASLPASSMPVIGQAPSPFVPSGDAAGRIPAAASPMAALIASRAMPVIRLAAPEPTEVRLPGRAGASVPVVEPVPAVADGPVASAPAAAAGPPHEPRVLTDDELTLDDDGAPDMKGIAGALVMRQSAAALPAAVSGHVSRRRRRQFLTPFREALLLLLLVLAAAFVYRAELKAMWDHRIRGIDPNPRASRPAPGPQPSAPPAVPAAGAAEVPPAVDPAPVENPGEPISQEESAAPSAPPAADPGTGVPDAAPPSMPDPRPAAAAEAPDKLASGPPPPEAAPATPPVAETRAADTSALPAGEAGAEALLRRLLAAVREEQVAPHIFLSDDVAAAVHAYYTGGRAAPVEPTAIRVERTDRSPVTGNLTRAFIVTTPDIPQGFPIAVEDTPGGPRVDWHYFVQCRDRALVRFVDTKTPASAVFYGTLERKHAFGEDLPPGTASRFHSFRFRSPLVSDTGVMVFVPKDSPLAARVAGFRWDVKYAPVVELTHRDGYIELTDLKHETWHGPRRKVSDSPEAAPPKPAGAAVPSPAAAEKPPAPKPATPRSSPRKPGA